MSLMYITRVVPLTLPNGAEVQVEARVPAEQEIGAFDMLPEAFSFEKLQDTIKGVAALVDGALDKVKPQKVAIEFGIELSLEAGKLTSVIVNGSTKGTIKISLEWHPSARLSES